MGRKVDRVEGSGLPLRPGIDPGKMTSNSGESRGSSSPKSGEISGGTANAANIGKAIVNSSRDFAREIKDANFNKQFLIAKRLIEEAISASVQLFSGQASRDNIVKDTIRGLKEDDSNIDAALDLAAFCLSKGVIYESSPSDPITTRTLICAGQNSGDNQTQIRNANTMAVAIRAGLAFDPKMVRLSAIRARECNRSLENTRAYANLALASIEKVAQPPDSEEALTFYSTVLATLANPAIQEPHESSLKDVSIRANLACDIAIALLDKNVSMNKVLPPGKLKLQVHQRMDALIQDLRVVSEKLSDLNLYIRVKQSGLAEARKREIISEEILRRDHAKSVERDLKIENGELADFDPREESDKILDRALRLLKRIIKNYQVESVTVNSTLASISRIDLPLNKQVCDVIKNIIREALENSHTSRDVEPLTLDVLSRVMISCDDPQVKASAIEIAYLANEKGIKFDSRTIQRIYDNTSEISLRNDQIPKRGALLEAVPKEVAVYSTPEPEHKSRRGLLDGFLGVSSGLGDGLKGGLGN